jgi:hypothetical protein
MLEQAQPARDKVIIAVLLSLCSSMFQPVQGYNLAIIRSW